MSSDQKKTLATFHHTGWWMGILVMACYNPYGSLWVVLHPLKFKYGTISFPLSNYNPTNRGFEHHQRLFAKVTFLKRHEVLLLLNLRECLATNKSGSWKTHRTEIFSGLFHGVPKNPIRKTRFLVFLAASFWPGRSFYVLRKDYCLEKMVPLMVLNHPNLFQPKWWRRILAKQAQKYECILWALARDAQINWRWYCWILPSLDDHFSASSRGLTLLGKKNMSHGRRKIIFPENL